MHRDKPLLSPLTVILQELWQTVLVNTLGVCFSLHVVYGLWDSSLDAFFNSFLWLSKVYAIHCKVMCYWYFSLNGGLLNQTFPLSCLDALGGHSLVAYFLSAGFQCRLLVRLTFWEAQCWLLASVLLLLLTLVWKRKGLKEKKKKAPCLVQCVCTEVKTFFSEKELN